VPTILLPVSSTVACANTPFQLAAFVAGDAPNTALQWFWGPTLLSGQTSATLTLGSPTVGTYRLEATTFCGSQSASFGLSVNPSPSVGIVGVPTNLALSGGSSVTLTASGADTYLWSVGGAVNPLPVCVAGPYSVTGTSTGTGCSATATVNVIGTLANGTATLQPGNWTDPAVWQCGRVPLLTEAVWLRHAIVLPPSTTANALRIRYDPAGRLTVGAGSGVRLK
jgi:hypothetical protein